MNTCPNRQPQHSIYFMCKFTWTLIQAPPHPNKTRRPSKGRGPTICNWGFNFALFFFGELTLCFWGYACVLVPSGAIWCHLMPSDAIWCHCGCAIRQLLCRSGLATSRLLLADNEALISVPRERRDVKGKRDVKRKFSFSVHIIGTDFAQHAYSFPCACTIYAM